MDKPPHLLVSISGHGYGHVAQTAPVLNALRQRLPQLKITVRSAAPAALLAARIAGPFRHIAAADDIGMRMSSALDVLADESAAAYAALHADWPARVAEAAAEQRALAPDFVLANVGYLPIAAAHEAGIPCAAMSSLNWADIYSHYCGGQPAAARIAAQIEAAYAGADAFLRLTPGMPMAHLPNLRPLGPVAAVGRYRRGELAGKLGLAAADRLVLVSLGGIASRLPLERWPRIPGVRWLVQVDWQVDHPDAVALETLGLPFADLMASCDALLCKPGYGSFVEAAAAGVAVLFVSRADWPETPCLTGWLARHGRAREVSRAALEHGELAADLAALWAAPPLPPPAADGASEAADWLAARLAAPRARH